MNRSFDSSQIINNYHLPPLNVHQSIQISPPNNRTSSYNQINSNKDPITRKIISTQNLAKIQDYETMNERQLLRQHQNLLKVLKKFQQLIDISITKKQKQKKHSNGRNVGKEQLMQQQVTNNKKIIQNHLNQIKELQSHKRMRSLDEILIQKAQVIQLMNKIKKDIFHLKNQDTIVGGKLITQRDNIEKELKDNQREFKIQLTKKAQFKKKIEQLTQQLQTLKQSSNGVNKQIKGIVQKKDALIKLNQKKVQLELMTKQLSQKDQSIHQLMVTKTKRNKIVGKDIQNVEKQINDAIININLCKEKVTKFQKVLKNN